MKNIILFIQLNFLFLSGVIAQSQFNCKSHDVFMRQMNVDPEFRRNQQQLEEETKIFMDNKSVSRPSSTTPYIIPVVFHIIYTTSAGNISDAQVMDQIAILNKEYPRQQADTVLTPAAFKPLAAGFNVEFRLATIDPNGHCTNGINRIYNTLSNCSFNDDDVKALSYWPSTSYLNIWVVESMHYANSMSCVGGAYATFPGGAANLDGINIRGDLISNIGTATTNSGWGNFKGRYLVHELGHWFNLRHIWGDATCGNDMVNDTPPAVTNNSGCPTFPHNPFNSCAGSGPDGEMYSNYMDYSNGPCLNIFTAGQVARMTACINSPVSGRSNLWSAANLNATGTNNPYIYPAACAANPDILLHETQVVCVGDSVSFTDNSYGGNSTSRLWNFTGGSASSVTDSIVRVQYNTPGLYSFSLTKNYQSSSKTTTFLNRVQVLDNAPNPNYGNPLSDSFEDPSIFATDWVIVNQDNDSTYWKLVNTTSYSGSNCVSIMNFGQPAPLTDDLISPAYDLSAVQNPTLTFRLHFANNVTANYDRLVIYISNDCGKLWSQIYSRTASVDLNTIPTNETSSYIPSVGSGEWRLEKINIVNSWASGTVRFKFSFTSGGGNNIFIDDVNINGTITTGLKQNYNNSEMSIFPNPAKDNIELKYALRENSEADVELFDVVGKICLSQHISSTKEGMTRFDISALKEGVYFIRLKQANGMMYNSKFIKQSGN
jgi:hypothetical protein